MRIALDAMGGDKAPEPIVAGAVQAVLAEPELHVVLSGDEAKLAPLLPGGPERQRLEIFHCTQVIGMDEKPALALRSKPDNSITHCWRLLASRKVEGIVSAGNTGAMVAGGHFMKRFLKGVIRPGIAAMLPTTRGSCVMLDVGANVHAKPEHLYQYGLMGRLYARDILGLADPKIGLMNIGEEEEKGHSLAIDTRALFMNSGLKESFVGNIEGRDIHKGTADVIVCDGFVGNVVLKHSEGAYSFFMGLVHQELLAPLQANAEKDRLLTVWRDLATRFDYSTYGGAPLLGIDGACIICHGSSGELAIKNALRVAARYARTHLSEAIVKELESNPPPAPSGAQQ